MMLMCVCRQIDTADFDSDDALRARILQDDFQCGLCQMQYLIETPHDQASSSGPVDDGHEEVSLNSVSRLRRRQSPGDHGHDKVASFKDAHE